MNVMPKDQKICIRQKVKLIIQKHEHKKGNSDYRSKLVDLHRNRKPFSPFEERSISLASHYSYHVELITWKLEEAKTGFLSHLFLSSVAFLSTWTLHRGMEV